MQYLVTLRKPLQNKNFIIVIIIVNGMIIRKNVKNTLETYEWNIVVTDFTTKTGVDERNQLNQENC